MTNDKLIRLSRTQRHICILPKPSYESISQAETVGEVRWAQCEPAGDNGNTTARNATQCRLVPAKHAGSAEPAGKVVSLKCPVARVWPTLLAHPLV